MTNQTISQFIESYLEAMNFTLGEEFEDSSFSDSLLLKANVDCVKFLQIVTESNLFQYIEEYIPQAGHDFWLTRNQHGAGFWDRIELYGEEASEQLTAISHSFKECELYVGDDNLIYC